MPWLEPAASPPAPARTAVQEALRPASHHLVVAHIEPVATDAVALAFAIPPDLREAFRFTQGQHIGIATPEVDSRVRLFSICSTPSSGTLRVAIRLRGDAAFRSYLRQTLRPGMTVGVTPATGSLSPVLATGQTKNYAAVAAGAGIAPVLSIAGEALAVEAASTFTILYGNRTTASSMLLDELERLEDLHLPRLKVFHALSAERPRRPVDFHGRIDASMLSVICPDVTAGGPIDEWLLSGPPALVVELERALTARGVDPQFIHHECDLH
jgi:ring-1,2-phenylacetyl-CoA epoxidase subunit PaaE